MTAEEASPTTHACPPDGTGVTPCCGRTPLELPADEAISTASVNVTCKGRPLTAEGLWPFALADARRQAVQEEADETQGPLKVGPDTPVETPTPDCPACKEPVTHVASWMDRVDSDGFRLRLTPCGHCFTIPDEAAADVTRDALDQARAELSDRRRAQREAARVSREKPPRPDDFVIALREDDGTLIVGIRGDGTIQQGPNYQPDAAADEFWQALTRAAQSANPLGGGQ